MDVLVVGGETGFPVLPPDSHGFDGNLDGVGCESELRPAVCTASR